MKKIIEVNDISQITNKKVEKKHLSKILEIRKSFVNSFKIENNCFLKLLNQVPIISHAFKYEKEFIAIIPNELKEGLRNGTLKILKGKDGNLISTIVDSKTGEIVRQLPLKELTQSINSVALSTAMSQICMQIQLDEIQQNISNFRIETNLKLDKINRKFHDDRIAKVDALKDTFVRYQNGEEITKKDLLLIIDEPKQLMSKEIETEIDCLLKYKNGDLAIDNEKNNEIQTSIKFILEAISSLQDIYFIEIFLNKNNEKKCYEITKKYSEIFINLLGSENLKLLNELSDFSLLDYKYNIWEKDLMPHIENLKSLYNNSIAYDNKA